MAALGLQHRRIPICAIGRDIYLDTRLILAKLESLPLPTPARLGATSPEQAALQQLLGAQTVAGGVFGWAIALLPPQLPIFTDPAWIADRTGFAPGGGPLAAPTPPQRAEAVANLRVFARLLEDTVLAGAGRDWVLGGARPGVADIEAVWALHWLSKIPGALVASEGLGPAQFPRVFAWVERFDRAVVAAAGKEGVVGAVKGEEAVKGIVAAEYFEKEGAVEEGEAVVQVLGLKKGDRVVVFPSDWGTTHKDVGSLVSIDEREVVFESKAQTEGSPTVRVHAPRLGFRIMREDQASHL